MAAEEVLRPRQGLYALPDTAEAQFHTAAHGGVPASTTAARLHGLWVLEDQKTHVWLGRSGRNLRDRPDGCCLHWSGGAVPTGKLPSVPRTLLQIAQCHDEERFFAAYESALRLRLLRPDGIRWLRRHLPVRMRWLIDFARDDADSGLESIVRLRLHRCGVDVRTQVRVYATGDVDLLIGDRLLIEIDGRENHESGGKRHKDLMRDANSALWGYETLRFDFAMVIYDWDLVEAAILAKIAVGAHLRPAR